MSWKSSIVAGFLGAAFIVLVAACGAAAAIDETPMSAYREYDASTRATYEFQCNGSVATVSALRGVGGRPEIDRVTFMGTEVELLDLRAIRSFADRVYYITHFDGTCGSNGIDIVLVGAPNRKHAYLYAFSIFIKVNPQGIVSYETKCIVFDAGASVAAARRDPECQGTLTYKK